MLYTMLTFYWFKAGCGKTVLMYEALWSWRNIFVDSRSKQILGDTLLTICKRTFQLEMIQ